MSCNIATHCNTLQQRFNEPHIAQPTDVPPPHGQCGGWGGGWGGHALIYDRQQHHGAGGWGGVCAAAAGAAGKWGTATAHRVASA